MANDGFFQVFYTWGRSVLFSVYSQNSCPNMIYGRIFTHQYLVLLSNLIKVLLIGSWVIAPCGFNGRVF